MKNINKQEELVSALWTFAKDLQQSENKDITSIDKKGYRTEMDTKAIRKAMETIGKIFNLEIQEIQ